MNPNIVVNKFTSSKFLELLDDGAPFHITIRYFLDCAGVSNADLSVASGVSVSCVSMVLAGKRNPESKAAVAVRKAVAEKLCFDPWALA